MRCVLIPIDGTKQDEAVARAVSAWARHDPKAPAIHLLNVQPPVRSYAGRFLGLPVVRDYQRAEAGKALAAARRVLDDAGLKFTVHIRVGESAETIASTADEIGASEIVMAGGGDGFFGTLMQRLLAARVIRRSKVPVVVVKTPRPALEHGMAGAGWRPSVG